MTDHPRCPWCGCRADATSVTEVRLDPETAAAMRRDADLVRRETGAATEAEAIAAACRIAARHLNLS